MATITAYHLINYTQTYKRLDTEINRYNQGRPLAQQLRTTHLHLAKELVRLYAGALKKAMVFNLSHAPAETLSLRTNSVQLAQRNKCCPRTVRSLISRLLKARIISHKQFHGSNSSYELWLNPDIIFESKQAKTIRARINNVLTTGEKPTEASAESSTAPPIENKDKMKTLPHTETFFPNVKKLNNTTIIPTENHAGESGDTNKKRKEGITLPRNSIYDEKRCAQKGDGKKGGAEPLSNLISVKKKDLAAGREDFLHKKRKQLAALLWAQAAETIYKNWSFAPWQVEKTKDIIYENFYASLTEKKLLNTHEAYHTMLLLAYRYTLRHPGYQLPRPEKYFSLTFSYGFTSIKPWYHNHLRLQRQRQHEKVLQNTINKLTKAYASGDGYPASLTEIYRQCEQRIGKLKNPLLMKQFYAEAAGIVNGTRYTPGALTALA